MRLNSGPAYLVTIARLTEVRRLRVGDGPYTITISTIDLSQLLGLQVGKGNGMDELGERLMMDADRTEDNGKHAQTWGPVLEKGMELTIT